MKQRNDKVRLTVDLDLTSAFQLAENAKSQGELVTTAIGRAIGTSWFLMKKETEEGKKVLLEDKNGKKTQLVFPWTRSF